MIAGGKLGQSAAYRSSLRSCTEKLQIGQISSFHTVSGPVSGVITEPVEKGSMGPVTRATQAGENTPRPCVLVPDPEGPIRGWGQLPCPA